MKDLTKLSKEDLIEIISNLGDAITDASHFLRDAGFIHDADTAEAIKARCLEINVPETLKDLGYTVENLSFGITAIKNGSIKFHGRRLEVIEWLKANGEI